MWVVWNILTSATSCAPLEIKHGDLGYTRNLNLAFPNHDSASISMIFENSTRISVPWRSRRADLVDGRTATRCPKLLRYIHPRKSKSPGWSRGLLHSYMTLWEGLASIIPNTTHIFNCWHRTSDQLMWILPLCVLI